MSRKGLRCGGPLKDEGRFSRGEKRGGETVSVFVGTPDREESTRTVKSHCEVK